MSREDFIAVCTRLFSIYVAINEIEAIPSALRSLSHSSDDPLAVLYLLVIAAILGICFFLWFFPLTVARKLLPVMREEKSEETIGPSVALSLGLTLIGVWLLARSIIDISFWISMYVRSRQAIDLPMEWSLQQTSSIVASLVKMLLSFWLILGSRGIASLIRRFRYGDNGDAL